MFAGLTIARASDGSPAQANEQLIRASILGNVNDAAAALHAGADPNAVVDFGTSEHPESFSAIDAATFGESEKIFELLLNAGAQFPQSSMGLSTDLFVLVLANRRSALGALYSRSLLPDSSIRDLLDADIGICVDPQMFIRSHAELRAIIMHQPTENTILEDIDRYGCFPSSNDSSSIKTAAQVLEYGKQKLSVTEFRDAVTSRVRRAIDSGDVVLAQYLEKYTAPLKPTEWQDLVVSASRAGNFVGLKNALPHIKDLNIPDSKGMLALQAACKSGNAETVNLLLANGADVRTSGQQGEVPLSDAVESGSSEVVSALISAGAPIEGNGTDESWPLRAAVNQGRPLVVEMLLEHGANVARRAADGSSALHVTDGTTISEAHAEIVQRLVAAGLDINSRNAHQVSIFAQALSTEDPTRLLAKAVYRAGTKLNAGDIREVFEYRDVDLLQWLLASGLDGNSSLGSMTILEAAALYAYHTPDLARVIIDAGAKIPENDNWKWELLGDAIRNNSPRLVTDLLRSGPILHSAAFGMDPVELAITWGAADVIPILDQSQEKVSSVDSSGRNAAHRVVEQDLFQRSRGGIPIIRRDQERALAYAIDAGLSLDAKDSSGVSVMDMAARNVETGNALQSAIALAGTSTTPLISAVRNDGTEEIERLIAAGADINVSDNLGRTPLTLALSLGEMDVAAMLLKRGANIAVLPERAYLRADTYYARDERLSTYFRSRLLQDQLLVAKDLAPATEAKALVTSLEQSMVQPRESTSWEVSCVTHCTAVHISGTQTLDGGAEMDVRQWIEGDATVYEISRHAPEFNFLIGGGFLGGPFLIKTVWTVTGIVSIPECNAKSDSKVLCYPSVQIANLSPVLEWDKDVPVVALKVKQNNRTTDLVPGMSEQLDRSEGPIQIIVDPFRSATDFDAKFRIQENTGPDFHASPDLSLEARIDTYARLAELRAELKTLLTQNGSSADIRTIQVAIRGLSASAIGEKYDHVVAQELRRRAEDITAVSDIALDLRKAVVSSASLGQSDIDLMLERLAKAKGELGTRDSEFLDPLKKQLEEARAIVIAQRHSVRFLAEHFNSNLDRMISDYQGLILEMAQYVSVDQLVARSTIPLEMISVVGGKLLSSDVAIDDRAAGGSGATIRRAFALPNPPTGPQ